MCRFVSLALVLLVAGAAPAAATPPGGNGKIAFVGLEPNEEHAHVFTVDPDGGNLTDLTPALRSYPWSVAWSPDGTELAFILPRPRPSDYEVPTRWSLHLMDAHGGNKRRILVFDGFLPTATWSPDGARIAFSGLDDDSLEIFSVARDGSALVQHTDFRLTLVFAPSWSPDGTRFAFNGDFTPYADDRVPLWTIGTNGTGRTRLSTSDSFGADWSPDGTRVLSAVGGGLRAVNADGSGSTLLRRIDTEWLPVWSPDGSRIALPADPLDGGFEEDSILALNADGSCPVTVFSGELHSPAWQPIPGGPATPEERCAELSVRGRADERFVRTARAFTLRALVDSLGNDPAPDALLRHPLPRGWAAESATSTHGSCTGTRPVLCDLGSLGPGERAEIMLRVRASTSAYRNPPRLRVSTSAADPDARDDTAYSPFVRVCDRLGTDGRDRLVGSARRDVICGLGGNDVIRGRGGNDLVLAGEGDDVVRGGAGADLIAGERGADRLLGGDGADRIEPGPGRDRAFGGAGDDYFDTWDRYPDLVDGGPGRDAVRDHDAFDVLRSIEQRNVWAAPVRARSLAETAGLPPAERVALARTLLSDRWGR